MILNVIGTVSSTVVTLSRSPEQAAVIAASAKRSATGRPFTFLAAHIARKLNRPVSLVILTVIIIPISNPNVLKSIYDIASSWVNIPKRIINDAPHIPTIVRCTFSEMINAYAATNMTIATIVLVSIESPLCRNIRYMNVYMNAEALYDVDQKLTSS